MSSCHIENEHYRPLDRYICGIMWVWTECALQHQYLSCASKKTRDRTLHDVSVLARQGIRCWIRDLGSYRHYIKWWDSSELSSSSVARDLTAGYLTISRGNKTLIIVIIGRIMNRKVQRLNPSATLSMSSTQGDLIMLILWMLLISFDQNAFSSCS